jgi:hypothetical protein
MAWLEADIPPVPCNIRSVMSNLSSYVGSDFWRFTTSVCDISMIDVFGVCHSVLELFQSPNTEALEVKR